MKIVSRIDHTALPLPIQRAYGQLVEALWQHGCLEPQLRELIRMRGAVEVDCRL